MLKLSPVRARSLVAAFALSALPLAAALPAHAVEVPTTAITQDTAVVVWLDFGGINTADVTKEILKLKAQMNNAEDGAKAEAFAKAFADFHGKFVKAGGEGVLMGLSQPAKEGDKPVPFVLIKTKPGANRAALETLLHGLAEQAKDDAKVSEAILSAKVGAYGTSKEWHALTGKDLVAPPINGTAKNALVFNNALKPAGKALFQLCFRMLPKMKADVQAQLDAQAKNPQQGGMMMAMAGGMMAPLVNLDTVLVVGDSAQGKRQINTMAHFADAKSAKDFTGGINGLIEMGKGMMGMQLAQMGKYGVDVKNANAMLATLVFKDQGQDTSLLLDNAFFDKMEQFAEQAKAAQAKMEAENAAKVVPALEEAEDEDASAGGVNGK